MTAAALSTLTRPLPAPPVDGRPGWVLHAGNHATGYPTLTAALSALLPVPAGVRAIYLGAELARYLLVLLSGQTTVTAAAAELGHRPAHTARVASAAEAAGLIDVDDDRHRTRLTAYGYAWAALLATHPDELPAVDPAAAA